MTNTYIIRIEVFSNKESTVDNNKASRSLQQQRQGQEEIGSVGHAGPMHD